MSNKNKITKLAKQLRALGVPEAEAASAAQMQIEEGVSQYAPFAFLHGAWQNVVQEGDCKWIEGLVERAAERPDEPGAGAGIALKRLLAAGADPADLTELVRVMQWQVLHGVCYQLADYASVEYPSEDMPVARWMLVELDEHDEPNGELGGLSELLLLTDPAGREMRPKKD